MTKADIADRIQTTTGQSKKDSLELLEAVLLIMKDTLESGENIKVSSFGVFKVSEKKDRPGRNPQTGEAMTIKGRSVLTFKPSAILRNEINHENKRP